MITDRAVNLLIDVWIKVSILWGHWYKKGNFSCSVYYFRAKSLDLNLLGSLMKVGGVTPQSPSPLAILLILITA